MKIAFLFFGLVAMCQGYTVKDELAELVDLLRSSTLPRKHTDNTRPMHTPSRSMMPPEVEPWEYDLDRLFEFPGSNFLLRLIERNFSDTTPLSNFPMLEFPEPQSPYFNTYLHEMEPKWTATTYMFYGEWADLADLFTRRITEWVAYRRFSCPSVFFDKIFARWSFAKLNNMLESDDGTLFEVIRSRLPNFFPNHQEADLDTIARDATTDVHWWIVDEVMQHIIGYGLRDVGVFSHKMYWRLTNYYQNMTKMGWKPEMVSPGYFGNIVMSVLRESNVRCHNGPEILRRYREAITMFRSRYEEYTVTAIRSAVMNFLWEKMGEPTTIVAFSEAHVTEITSRIRTYFDEILAELANYEPHFTSSDVTSLETFFRDMMKPEEVSLLPILFERLGLYTDNISGNMPGIGMPVNSNNGMFMPNNGMP